MGTGKPSIAKPSKAPTSVAPPADHPLPPPLPPAGHSDGSTSAQGVYGGGAAVASSAIPVFQPTPAVSSTYLWGSQYPMPPCGTPIAYAPMYPHGGIYAQPAMATGSVYIAAETERRMTDKKSKEKTWKGGEEMMATSESSNEDDSQSINMESEGSSSTSLQDDFATWKRNFGKTLQDGGSMQHTGSTRYDNTIAESSYTGKGLARKLPVEDPGREELRGPTFISAAASSSLMVGQKECLLEHHWMLDEHELKKQQRKQLNRESARRSRLRKQQEYQDLARRVDILNSENCALRREIEQLDKHCKELDSENASIAEELYKIFH